MRGIVVEVLLFMTFIMGIVLLIAMLTIGVPGWSGRITFTEIREDIYTMGNALVVARMYSETALKYSVHQACYDRLGNMDASRTEEAFAQELAREIENNMGAYTTGEDYNFLRDYNVELPNYDVSLESRNNENMTVSARGDDFLVRRAQEESRITLRRASALNETIDTNCWGLYRAAKSASETIAHDFEAAAQQAVSGFPTPGESVSGTVQTDSTCESLFSSITGKSYAQANSEVASALRASITGAAFNGITGVEKSHSFEEEPRLEVSGTKTSERVDPASGTTVTCTFTYRVTARPLIRLKDSSKTYPVWNGTNVSLEANTANFTISLDTSPTAPPAPLTINDLVGEYRINVVVTQPPEIEGNYIRILRVTDDNRARFGDTFGTVEIIGNGFTVRDASILLKDERSYPITFEDCIKTGEQISGVFKISYPQNIVTGNFISN